MMTLQLELKKVRVAGEEEPRTVLTVQGLPQNIVLAQGEIQNTLLFEITSLGQLRVRCLNDPTPLLEALPSPLRS